MHTKRFFVLVLCLLCLVLALPACGGSDDEADKPEENLPTINPKQWEGVYVEEIAHRATLTVTATGEQSAYFAIEWSGSAYSRASISMNGVYDPQKAAFVYEDAVWINKEFDADGRETDTVVYTQGKGSFTPGDRRLLWTDETDTGNGTSSFLYDKPLDSSGDSDVIIITPTPTPTPDSPTPTPAPSATPAPTPAPSATPAPGNLPIVKKSPTDETVREGGSCSFVAKYENATWAVWHFVSPDGHTDLTYEAAAERFPTLEIVNGMYSTMKLNNIPIELNGWRVYCRYSNSAGYTDTKTATITVTAAPTPSPAPTAAPTPEPTEDPGPVVNQWVDTSDLNEAVTGSGVSFTPPLEQTIPEGLHLKTYRYMNGIIEAAYANDQDEIKLRIRKSYSVSGTELSGDMNQYSTTWDLTIKGLTLRCMGDGTTVNACYFSSWYDNYSIVCNPGVEGSGLTPDQLNSIINSMQ